ncbi:MAG: oligosaccharide flippase family protein [Oscillospiraceae bacterium]|nr:oligosaccharide flippase family protein [Oscillospiraceae bacterium]
MKSKNASIKKNFIMEIFLTMSNFIFPLITFPYASRILKPEGTGKIQFATATISYFLIIAQLGIPKYGIRACAKVRDNYEELTRTTHELFFINLIMTAVAYAGLAVSIVFIPKYQNEKLLLIIISCTIFFHTIGMEWLYKALEKYTYITIRSVIFKLIALVAMFLLVHKKEDYLIYGAITILASSFSCVFNFFHARKYIGIKLVGNYNLHKHIKAVAVFFAMACATTVYTHLDTLMLGFMKSDTEVGYYNAAVKIKTIMVSIVISLGTVLLPRASYYIQTGKMKEFQSITKKSMNFAVLLATPLMLYFMLFAKSGILFLSGSEYTNSIVPMQLIMPTLLLIGMSNVTGIQILVPTGREKIVLYSEIAGAVVDLGLNAVLIPRYASSGAAIGTVVAEVVVLAVQTIALRREIAPVFLKIPFVKMLIALSGGTVAAIWVLWMNWHSFITLAVSGCLFFAVYGALLLLLKEPLVCDIMQQVLKSLKRKLGKRHV